MIFVWRRIGILRDALEDRRVFHDLPGRVTPEDRAQVEAEPVDVHLHHPVAQAVDDERSQ